jgi:hypothetical protein
MLGSWLRNTASIPSTANEPMHTQQGGKPVIRKYALHSAADDKNGLSF